MVNRRQCSRCGRDADATSFPVTGSHRLECRRSIVRAHYEANREYYKLKARRRQRRIIEETRAWLIQYLRTHPCVDCGATDMRVLEFDHRDGSSKSASVAVLDRSGYPLARVQAEVMKCDARCANCHRIRTHSQRHWWGADVDSSDAGLTDRAERARRDSNPQHL
jgi:hypothetical protein